MQARFEINEGGNIIIPPGRYWLGDPCYAVTDDQWQRLLANANHFDPDCGGNNMGEVDGFKVVAFRTAHGDGEYDSSEGSVFVNSGLLGLVLPPADRKVIPDGMIEVEFEDAETCLKNDGVIHLGHARFDTTIHPMSDF